MSRPVKRLNLNSCKRLTKRRARQMRIELRIEKQGYKQPNIEKQSDETDRRPIRPRVSGVCRVFRCKQVEVYGDIYKLVNRKGLLWKWWKNRILWSFFETVGSAALLSHGETRWAIGGDLSKLIYYERSWVYQVLSTRSYLDPICTIRSGRQRTTESASLTANRMTLGGDRETEVNYKS